MPNPLTEFKTALPLGGHADYRIDFMFRHTAGMRISMDCASGRNKERKNKKKGIKMEYLLSELSPAEKLMNGIGQRILQCSKSI